MRNDLRHVLHSANLPSATHALEYCFVELPSAPQSMRLPGHLCNGQSNEIEAQSSWSEAISKV